jgi:hypothetical protein
MGHLCEHRENILQHRRRDADAVVAHPHNVFGGHGRHLDPDASAAVGVLGGIVEQVGKHLRQPQWVGLERRAG